MLSFLYWSKTYQICDNFSSVMTFKNCFRGNFYEWDDIDDSVASLHVHVYNYSGSLYTMHDGNLA